MTLYYARFNNTSRLLEERFAPVAMHLLRRVTRIFWETLFPSDEFIFGG